MEKVTIDYKFVRHISSNGHSWSKSIWIKRDAETWQTEKGE